MTECRFDSSCPMPVDCALNFIGTPDIEVGQTNSVSVGSYGTNPPIEITLTSSNTGVARVCGGLPGPCASASYTDNVAPFTFASTGVAAGSVDLNVSGITAAGVACQGDTITVNVDVPIPGVYWCQFMGGSAMANGSILCPVPALSYLFPTNALGSTGLPIVGGTVTFAPGLLSPTNWKVEGMPYAGTLPSYTTFRNRIPSTVTIQYVGNSVNQAALTSGGTEYPAGSGYYYYLYDGGVGNLSLYEISDGSIDIGDRKVILFVENASTNINSKIRVNPGRGFFMLISSGSILVWDQVGGLQEIPPVPDIEGVYFTDGVFSTSNPGISVQQLHVRGVMVSIGGIQMLRESADNTVPSELFEFGADQSLMIPSIFSKRTLNWREVLP